MKWKSLMQFDVVRLKTVAAASAESLPVYVNDEHQQTIHLTIVFRPYSTGNFMLNWQNPFIYTDTWPKKNSQIPILRGNTFGLLFPPFMAVTNCFTRMFSCICKRTCIDLLSF